METEATPTEREATLAGSLAALSHPVRLALMRQLRRPKALSELRVRALPDEEGGSRPLARQTVKEHLEKLLAIGVVASQETERDYGTTVEYVLSQPALYALSEEFRDLASLQADTPLDEDTLVGAPARAPFAIEGPCLVLVKGVEEGRTFRLAQGPGRRQEWVVGRRRGLPVSLEFDPFVSTENARLVREDGAFYVQDLQESRNGTRLNFQPLPKGGRHVVRTGDLIGVGRSLLMLRE